MPKVDEINLDGTSVTAESVAEEVVVPEKTETIEENKEKPVDAPQWAQEEIAKLREERDNLSKAVSRLNQERKLPKDEEKEEEETSNWDDDSQKFQKETLERAEKIAEKKAQALLETHNEKVAISEFLDRHPELSDKNTWSEVMTNYHPKNGRGTTQAIVKDLERAFFLTQYEKGELSQKEENKAEKMIADLTSVGKTGTKAVKQGNVLTAGEIRLAEAMRVDLKKLAAEDLSKPAEIKL